MVNNTTTLHRVVNNTTTLQDRQGKPCVNLCVQDNEGVFLAAGYSAANQEACIDYSIIEGALTPQQTSSYQAADRANGGFRDWKRTVRKNRLDDNIPINASVEEQLVRAFVELKEKFSMVTITKAHGENLTRAMLGLCMEAKNVRPHRKCGMHLKVLVVIAHCVRVKTLRQLNL